MGCYLNSIWKSLLTVCPCYCLSSYSDDSPLIKNEIFNEPHITLATLCDPEDFDLGVALEKEPESWYDSVNEETGKSLKNKQVSWLIVQYIIYNNLICRRILIDINIFYVLIIYSVQWSQASRANLRGYCDWKTILSNITSDPKGVYW